MPRRPRVFVDGAIYHVFCRVGRGEAVFEDAAEASALVDVIREVKRRDELTLFAWCVMSNHYHLALRTGRVPLWRTMRLVQGRFAKGHNRRHQVYGPLWQGRYKATLVTGGQHLRQVIAYIHMNPVVAGAVRDPAKYRMSGHRELLGTGDEASLVDIREALLPFGASLEAGLRAYLSVLPAVGRRRWAAGGPERLPWWREIAPPEARQEREPPRLDALGGSSEISLPALSAEAYVLTAATALETSLGELAGPRSGREITRNREMLAAVAVERYRIKVKDLARQFAKNPSVVSRWVSEAGRRRAVDEDFRERLEQLAANIRSPASRESLLAEESEFLSGMGGEFVD